MKTNIYMTSLHPRVMPSLSSAYGLQEAEFSNLFSNLDQDFRMMHDDDVT